MADIGNMIALDDGSWGVITGRFALSGALFLCVYCADTNTNTIVELR